MQNQKRVLIVIDSQGSLTIRVKGLKCFLALEQDHQMKDEEPGEHRLRPRWGTGEE